MKNDMLAAREFLVEELRKELLGPGSENSIPDAENEVITDLPESRYSVGILFPQMNSINTENDDPSSPDANTEDSETEEQESAIEGDSGERGEDHVVPETTEIKTLDDDISLATQRKPSSMGFTFFSATDMEQLTVQLEFGTYRKAKMEDCQVRFTPPYEGYRFPQRLEQYVYMDSGYLRLCLPLKRKDVGKFFSTDEIGDVFLQDYLYKLSSQFESKGFKREPHKTEIIVDFNNSNAVEVTDIEGKPLKFTAIKRKNSSGLTAVTVMLVNMAEGKYDGKNSIFQPKMRVDTLNNHFHFEEYSKYRSLNTDDTEEQNLDLLYRGKKVFATGHGTSVDWDIDNAGNGCLWNEFLPVADVPQMNFESEDTQIGAQTFSMKFMSDLHVCDKKEKIEQLHSLVASYSRWIDKISSEAELLSECYLSAAKENIGRCREASARMTRGLTYLRNNSNAYTAFELANRAMYMQRIHGFIQHKDSMPNDESLQTILHEINYYEAANYYGDAEPKWRPFQLAFLLQSIASIVDDDGDERNLVDLIWFPTGGGKTEAYLGLTAFTIFYRKLENQLQSAGTAVIMRYTLRLLAAQQFTRASILICACEAIRRDSCGARKYPSYPLGNDEINIGLWIGSEHTPNKNDKAKDHLNELNKASGYNLREQKSRHNKFQILKCPWCGTKLVKEVDAAGKLSGRWGYQMDSSGRFYLHCTQEGCLFENRLPIQIVDDELYRKPPSLLFGTVDKFAMLAWKPDIGNFFGINSNNKAPELIIQDELHLISGPLGTMVGLYETAVDALCKSKGVSPKIIASTATIRRAASQCSSLFNRDVRQFPPPGIAASDSYFARETPLDKKPGRLYMGVMPAGKTKAMMEVLSIATLLQKTHQMPFDDVVKDKYWTLTTYFNSLRDLGKCATLVDDDVKDSIRRLAARLGRRNDSRPTGAASELTSRVSTTQLNETLHRLENVEYSKQNQEENKYAIGVLLATNMISVGVDVERLNLMLMVGQPKLTSEYIQASSRVGRKYPGLAVVLYDASKSRDRSHYEQFKAYHDSFYKYVEPTGLTPFAKPARDRGLHAVSIALIRNLSDIKNDNRAGDFHLDLPILAEIKETILSRASEINSRLKSPLRDESKDIEFELNSFWDDWVDYIAYVGSANFWYGDRFIVKAPDGDAHRLIKPYGHGHDSKARETLTSMRNVDQNVASNILVWEDEHV